MQQYLRACLIMRWLSCNGTRAVTSTSRFETPRKRWTESKKRKQAEAKDAGAGGEEESGQLRRLGC